MKILPTHLELNYLPHSSNTSSREDIQTACTEVCRAIKAGIERITADINYIRNIGHKLTFYCEAKECAYDSKHPAKLKRSLATNELQQLVCSKDPQRRCSPPTGYDYWLQGLDARYETAHTKISDSHLSVLIAQLSKHAAQWKEIGTNLGFHQWELRNIESAPTLLQRAPESWLIDMLSKWLEWAPRDKRGSTQYATLNSLKRAIRKTGLGKTAEKLTLLET